LRAPVLLNIVAVLLNVSLSKTNKQTNKQTHALSLNKVHGQKMSNICAPVNSKN